MPVNLEHNETLCPKNFISKAEEVYNAKFLGHFLFNGDKDFSQGVFFFYCKNPQNEKHSKYFALYPENNGWWIVGAEHFEGREIVSLCVDGKYYYSGHHHDFVYIDEYFIDGGEFYVRTNAPDKIVNLFMKDGEWHVRKN